MIARALRAGHSLRFGLQMVADEMPDPSAPSSPRPPGRSRSAASRAAALAGLAYRVEPGDLPFFVTAVLIQRETGGNLAEVLENLGTLIRERFELYGRVRALTAIGKASADLLAAMPLMLVLLMYTCGGEGGRSGRGSRHTPRQRG